MSRKKGLLFVFVAALLFSIGGLCVKMIPWNALSINSFRSLISVCILLVFAKVTHHPLKLTSGVMIGACAMCAVTTLYAMANKLTTAANTILLQFTAPVFVILILWIFFREPPKKLDVIASLCVFGGIACFFVDSLGAGNLLGNLLAVLSGVAYAGVFLLNRFPGADPLFATILGQAMAAVLGLPWLVRETDFSGSVLPYAIALGVFQLGLAYAFFTTGIRVAPPVSASLVTGIEPILNPIWVALVVGETISGLSLVGGAIVFLTIMIYNLLAAREKSKANAPSLEKG